MAESQRPGVSMDEGARGAWRSVDAGPFAYSARGPFSYRAYWGAYQQLAVMVIFEDLLQEANESSFAFFLDGWIVERVR